MKRLKNSIIKNITLLASLVFYGIILYVVLRVLEIDIKIDISFIAGFLLVMLPEIFVPVLIINFIAMQYFSTGIELKMISLIISFIYTSVATSSAYRVLNRKRKRIELTLEDEQNDLYVFNDSGEEDE